jgi:hypothetical protein
MILLLGLPLTQRNQCYSFLVELPIILMRKKLWNVVAFHFHGHHGPLALHDLPTLPYWFQVEHLRS